MSAPAVLAELMLRHRAALAMAGAAALVLGAWMAAAAYGAPTEERHAEQVTPWRESATYTYAVPVTRNSTHWPIGTMLPMGQPAYFRTVSDSLLIDFAWSALTADEARGVAAASMVLEVRAQTSDGRPYWTTEHALGEATATSYAEGLSMHARLDLDALTEEVQRISRELPVGEGVVNWTVRTTVVHALEIGGRLEHGETVYLLPIEVVEPRFFLPPAEELTWERAHTEERVVTTSSQAGMAGALSSGSALGLLAAGILLLGVAGAAGSIAPDAFAREHRRFRDWVSVADRVPDLGSAVVDVGSLEDLVQVASDARTRVLLDAADRVYYALLPGVTYRYARHAAPSG